LSAIYNTANLTYTDDIIKMIQNQQAGDWREYLKTYNLWHEHVSDWKLNDKSIVLDIGAGAGITSLWLQKQYGCRIILLDTTDELDKLDKPKWGWHPSETNCVDVVKEFWRINGGNFEFHNAHNPDWSNIPKLDLVLSKSSWGVHYHIDTYFDKVHARKPNYMYINWRATSKQHALFLQNGYAMQPVGPADYVNKTWLYKVYASSKPY